MRDNHFLIYNLKFFAAIIAQSAMMAVWPLKQPSQIAYALFQDWKFSEIML